jgi:S1-C subfamily serine protease
VRLLRKALFVFFAVLGACGAPPDAALLTLHDDIGCELPAETLASIGLSYGLAVVKAGASAERAGLRVGDVVYGVNQTRLRDARELRRLAAASGEQPLTLLVRRGKSDFYVDLRSGNRSNATDTPLRT